MTVLDASVVVELVLGTRAGLAILDRYFDGRSVLHAPSLVDVEVVQVLRRYVARREVADGRAREALDLLAALPIRRHDHGPLLERAWALRANMTVYDAVYVALAEGLRATLVTRDRKLAGAPGVAASGGAGVAGPRGLPRPVLPSVDHTHRVEAVGRGEGLDHARGAEHVRRVGEEGDGAAALLGEGIGEEEDRVERRGGGARATVDEDLRTRPVVRRPLRADDDGRQDAEERAVVEADDDTAACLVDEEPGGEHCRHARDDWWKRHTRTLVGGSRPVPPPGRVYCQPVAAVGLVTWGTPRRNGPGFPEVAPGVSNCVRFGRSSDRGA